MGSVIAGALSLIVLETLVSTGGSRNAGALVRGGRTVLNYVVDPTYPAIPNLAAKRAAAGKSSGRHKTTKPARRRK